MVIVIITFRLSALDSSGHSSILPIFISVQYGGREGSRGEFSKPGRDDEPGRDGEPGRDDKPGRDDEPGRDNDEMSC